MLNGATAAVTIITMPTLEGTITNSGSVTADNGSGERAYPEDPESIFFARFDHLAHGGDVGPSQAEYRRKQRLGYPLHRVEGPQGVRTVWGRRRSTCGTPCRPRGRRTGRG